MLQTGALVSTPAQQRIKILITVHRKESASAMTFTLLIPKTFASIHVTSMTNMPDTVPLSLDANASPTTATILQPKNAFLALVWAQIGFLILKATASANQTISSLLLINRQPQTALALHAATHPIQIQM